jgi:mannose-6-phosphate isomerase-like protein (cupin superfamily)
MMDVKDVLAELAAVPEGTFLDIVDFNEHHIGACSITGVSPVWEMHPDTDEFFFVLEGNFEVTVLTDTGAEHFVAPAGSTFVVPRGLWNKPAAPTGARFLYLTPGQSLHSEAENPRTPDE